MRCHTAFLLLLAQDCFVSAFPLPNFLDLLLVYKNSVASNQHCFLPKITCLGRQYSNMKARKYATFAGREIY